MHYLIHAHPIVIYRCLYLPDGKWIIILHGYTIMNNNHNYFSCSCSAIHSSNGGYYQPAMSQRSIRPMSGRQSYRDGWAHTQHSIHGPQSELRGRPQPAGGLVQGGERGRGRHAHISPRPWTVSGNITHLVTRYFYNNAYKHIWGSL